ncbi:hypothetical protein [Jannaschia sp. 2305UL9-9]|uniref:hypothetical protein n=1 Tax=Jannaschia sp. 2305UL9-9 TaxID=3121638 RepID=UPI003529D3F5
MRHFVRGEPVIELVFKTFFAALGFFFLWGAMDLTRFQMRLGIFFPFTLMFPSSRAFQKPKVDPEEDRIRMRLLVHGIAKISVVAVIVFALVELAK